MTDDLVKRLRTSADPGMVHEAAERIEEMDRIFDLRWECDRRAIKQWQEAHPGNDRTWPDQADLCVWLMMRVERLEKALENIAQHDVQAIAMDALRPGERIREKQNDQ